MSVARGQEPVRAELEALRGRWWENIGLGGSGFCIWGRGQGVSPSEHRPQPGIFLEH